MKEIKNKILPGLIKLFFSKTARSTYVVFLGNGLSAFFAFLFTITYIRNFSFSDIGYFSALWSLLLLVSDLADIGIGTSLSRFLPPLFQDKRKLLAFLKTAFLLQLSIALITTILLLILSYQLSNIIFHRGDFTYLVRVTTIGIFFAILSNFCQYALSARQQFIKVGFLSAFSSLIRFVILILLIYISLLNLNSLVWTQMLSIFILLVVSLVFLDIKFIYVKRIKGDLERLIKFTFFLGTARGLTALAGRLDVLMLVALKNPVEAGIYSIASRVISIYPLLSGSFSTVIAPRLASIKDSLSLRNFINKVILATLGIIGTIILLIIAAHPFMVILFPDKGILAVSIFRLLLLSMVFFVASVPVVSIVIYYLKKPQILTINSIIQLFIVVIGNLILIPLYGRYGAAISLIIAYGVTLITTTGLCLYHLKVHHEKH